MHLNTISPSEGSKKTKVRKGRGIGSGHGKTCGRGHKGQTSRSGGTIRWGFEGGQMPFHQRVPKFGFVSLKKKYTAEVRLSELNKLEAEKIDLSVLKAAGIVPAYAKKAKLILSGKLEKPMVFSGVLATAGAKEAVESLGGKFE